MTHPLESKGGEPKRKQSIEELNSVLYDWEARKDPGPFLRTLVTYLTEAGHSDVETVRKICRDIGSHMMVRNSRASYNEAWIKGTYFDELDFENMYDLGDALLYIGNTAQTLTEVMHDLRAGNEVVKRVAGEWWTDEVDSRILGDV